MYISEYEFTLSLSQNIAGPISITKNIPGAINHLIEETAKAVNADYVILDTSPSLSALNMNLFACSDYILIPAAPDFYSVQAFDSLSTVLPKWKSKLDETIKSGLFDDAIYKIPNKKQKFLGILMQNYRVYDSKPSKSFQYWIDKINQKLQEKFVPALSKEDLMFDDSTYSKLGIKNYTLSQVKNFNSLIAVAQKSQKPVFEIIKSDVKTAQGFSWDEIEKSIAQFQDTFSDLTEKVLSLTKNV